jgi:hypothetical protein
MPPGSGKKVISKKGLAQIPIPKLGLGIIFLITKPSFGHTLPKTLNQYRYLLNIFQRQKSTIALIYFRRV